MDDIAILPLLSELVLNTTSLHVKVILLGHCVVTTRPRSTILLDPIHSFIPRQAIRIVLGHLHDLVLDQLVHPLTPRLIVSWRWHK